MAKTEKESTDEQLKAVMQTLLHSGIEMAEELMGKIFRAHQSASTQSVVAITAAKVIERFLDYHWKDKGTHYESIKQMVDEAMESYFKSL